MPFEQFIEKNFHPRSMRLIETANSIIEEFQAQGFTLTLRQLYYQFVARDVIPNNLQSYKALGSIINDARLAGLIDWDAIEDRMRSLETNWHQPSPHAAGVAMRNAYAIDMWANQPQRVQVWVEKDAMSAVIEKVCRPLDVPYLACRGYVSQSEQYRAMCRIRDSFNEDGQSTTILHLGDHDPSGIDMTRDNRDRLCDQFQLGGEALDVVRIALNHDQILKYKPPHNPAKQTDSRFAAYAAEFGTKSWELDALNPKVIADLVTKHVVARRDAKLWNEKVAQLHDELERIDDAVATLE